MKIDTIGGLIARDVNESDRRAVAYSLTNDPCNYCKDVDTAYCLTRCNYRGKVI